MFFHTMTVRHTFNLITFFFIIVFLRKYFNTFLIKIAFRPGEKLPYFFTIHYYFLLSKKFPWTGLVNSEE